MVVWAIDKHSPTADAGKRLHTASGCNSYCNLSPTLVIRRCCAPLAVDPGHVVRGVVDAERVREPVLALRPPALRVAAQRRRSAPRQRQMRHTSAALTAHADLPQRSQRRPVAMQSTLVKPGNKHVRMQLYEQTKKRTCAAHNCTSSSPTPLDKHGAASVLQQGGHNHAACITAKRGCL